MIENARDAPVARLGEWLTAAGAELDVRNAEAGDPLPEELAGYARAGGAGRRHGRLRRRPGALAAAGAPVCWPRRCGPSCRRWGSAWAASCWRWPPAAGSGRPSSASTGRSWSPSGRLAATDPLLRELPITPDVLQWHVDEVSQLPPGAVLLASSPGCEVQAFRVGRLAWGTQFHIETTPDIVRAWAATDAELLADYDLATIVRRAVDGAPGHRRDLAAGGGPVRRDRPDPAAAAGPRTLPTGRRCRRPAAARLSR